MSAANDANEEEWGAWGASSTPVATKTNEVEDDSDWGDKPPKPSNGGWKKNDNRNDRNSFDEPKKDFKRFDGPKRDFNDRDRDRNGEKENRFQSNRGGFNNRSNDDNDGNKRFERKPYNGRLDEDDGGYKKSYRDHDEPRRFNSRQGDDEGGKRFDRNDGQKSGWNKRDDSGERRNRNRSNSNDRKPFRKNDGEESRWGKPFKSRDGSDDEGYKSKGGWKQRDENDRDQRSNFKRDDDNRGGHGRDRDDNRGGFGRDRDDNRGGFRRDREERPKNSWNNNNDDHREMQNNFRPKRFSGSGDEGGFKPKRFNRDGDDDLPDRFNRDANIDDRRQVDNDQEDEPQAPKRVTYVPDDEEADYFLHVNSGINFENYEKIPVEVTGDDVPEALTSFSSIDMPDFVKDNIELLKYKTLTPVQKYAIPIINSRRDLMSCAQTGSGKTFAFLLPIITSIHAEVEDPTETKTVFPKALIMAPTRELCRQIYTAAHQLCKGSKIKCGYVYGGIEMNKSRRNLMDGGCDILVATPGRLIHFLELVWISLKYLKFLVLDEADRMLDAEGFYDSVNKVYEEANCFGDDRTIQISMFSATFPNEIQNLAKNLLKNYLFLAVGVIGSANCDVQQEVIQADQKEKVNKAVDYIKSMPDQKTLIFVESKRMADFFGIKLGYLGYKATTIHGDRDQQQRESALNDFKSGRVEFMVATNVAARGLDIPKVDTVINIDMPNEIDTYVHRIGRTGRCGNVGRAVSFFDEEKDLALAPGLITKLEEANQACPDWLKLLSGGAPNGQTRRYNQNRDNRSDVRVNKFANKQDDEDDFMKGSNANYEDRDATQKVDDNGWLSD